MSFRHREWTQRLCSEHYSPFKKLHESQEGCRAATREVTKREGCRGQQGREEAICQLLRVTEGSSQGTLVEESSQRLPQGSEGVVVVQTGLAVGTMLALRNENKGDGGASSPHMGKSGMSGPFSPHDMLSVDF